MPTDQQLVPGVLRTPRAAAIAGIAFAVSFGAIVVLLRVATPANPDDAGTWLKSSSHRGAVHAALNLVPFCGIFFLWFIGVVRSRVGDAEDKFFATLFLGSGLLFVAMLFVLAAMAGGIYSAAGRNHGSVPLSVWQFARPTTAGLATNYALRMAAVFTISTSIIFLRLGYFNRWLARLGFLVGLFLLLVASSIPWIELLFPAWVLAVSIHLLLMTFGDTRPESEAEPIT
jgi:hypothetical protein